jgi:hypothetical protein
MSTEDEMTIDEGHKYLRRMKKTLYPGWPKGAGAALG